MSEFIDRLIRIPPYQKLLPRARRAFLRSDQKALAEITKRLRRCGYSREINYRSSIIMHGYEAVGTFCKMKKIEDNDRYKDYHKDYPNAVVTHVLFLHRNMSQGRTHPFFDNQIAFRKNFPAYKEIIITGGYIMDYDLYQRAEDGSIERGLGSSQSYALINVRLSALMPNISGALKKRSISNLSDGPSYYLNDITRAYQLCTFLESPVRARDIDYVAARLPFTPEPAIY